MAVAFDRVLGLLDPESQLPQSQQSGQVIASTEGQQSSGAGGSYAPQAAQPEQSAQPRAQAGARGKVMAKNAERATAPTNMGKISENISSAKSRAQQEANSYMSAATQPYQVDRGAIQNELRNYAGGAQSDIGTRLTSAPGLVEDIKLSDTGVGEDVGLLQNDAGIRELFRRGQDARGTIGESALDAALLRRNQPFQAQRGDVLKSYQDLLKERSDIEDTSRGKAQEARNKAADEWKGAVKGEAQGIVGSLEEAARKREQEFDAGIEAAKQARYGQISSEAQALADQLAGNYTDPYMQEAIRQSFGQGTLNQDVLDPYKYYTPAAFDSSQTDYKDFYQEPEAQQFERLMGLLGGGETRAPGKFTGKTAADVAGGTFDKNALTNAILERAGITAKGNRENMDRMAAEEKARQDAMRTASIKVPGAPNAEAAGGGLPNPLDKRDPNPLKDPGEQAAADAAAGVAANQGAGEARKTEGKATNTNLDLARKTVNKWLGRK